MVTDYGTLFVLLFSPLPPPSHCFERAARQMSQLATRQMRRLRLMVVTSSTKQAGEAGEAHFDHIHLIYEPPLPLPQHLPFPSTNPHTPRCRQVKDRRRRNQSEGPRARLSFRPRFH